MTAGQKHTPTVNKETAPTLKQEGAAGPHAIVKRRSRRGRAARFTMYFVLVPLLLLVVGAAIFLYLFQGQQITHSSIDGQVQTSLQNLVGDDYRVTVGKTGLSLISTSILALNGENVELSRAGEDQAIASLTEVKVGLDPLSILQGKPNFDKLLIEGGRIDLAKLNTGGETPGDLKQILTGIGKQLWQVSRSFADGTIESIEVSELLLDNAAFGRRTGENQLRVENAVLSQLANGGITIQANLVTSVSSAVLSATWQVGDQNEGYMLSAGMGPFNTLEWLPPADPMVALTQDGKTDFGLNTSARIDFRASYDVGFQPSDPYVKIQAEGGNLRLGVGQTKPLRTAVFNLRSNLDTGAISLERADLAFGEFGFVATGEATPVRNGNEIQLWELKFDLSDFSSADKMWRTVDGAQRLQVAGSYTPQSSTLDFPSISLLDGDDSALQATARLVYGGAKSPALSGKASSPALQVETLQNFWPFHIAPPLRNWIRTRLVAGTINELELDFDFAGGRIAEIAAQESGFREGEFSLKADLRGVRLKTFGEVPELANASGTLSIDASRLDAKVAQGVLDPPGEGRVEVSNTAFAIPDMFEQPARGTIDARLSAGLSALASLANSKPLVVADTIGIKPAELSGEAVANVKADFLLIATPPRGSTKWNAAVKLTNAASKSELFGQKINAANVDINAEPTLVTAAGTAMVNGFDVKLNVAEPINGGPASKRSRTITTTLDHKALAQQGIDVSQIITGRMAVSIETNSEGKDRYTIDMTQADITLPWISWDKGSGRTAKASFVLSQSDGINTLSDFSFTGDAFRASGKLSFNKAGLLNANLSNVALVKGDNFDVSVARKGNRFEIAANGRSFDGRSIINKVIHGDGFSSETSKTDVSLTANFGRLAGFNGQVMENALVRYDTSGGLLTRLEVRGANEGQLSKIDAFREGNTTTFTFASGNAGSALSMVDLYRKMEGGKLSSKLVRNGNGPFTGNVAIRNFVVAGEERLKSLVAAPVQDRQLQRASGRLQELDVQRVRFDDMRAGIVKDKNFFSVEDGRLRNAQIGLTFDGTIYDQKDQMSVRGTFMPLFAISRLIGGIPIIGDILSNGKNQGLIGITYRLKGAADNPNILVNPISIIAPGIFRQIFEFQE